MFTIQKRISSILLWSVISAAFIGPGTLVASSSAGSLFKYQLIWALIFATVACVVLQEMAARISIVTGLNLSKLLRTNFNSWSAYFIGLAVVLGCAAYEAGNILGALSGISVIWEANRVFLLVFLGVGVFLLLWFGRTSGITKVLGMLVAFMGVIFVIVAFKTAPSFTGILKGIIPSLPESSEWITLALIGTTIVPYNIYLGSGLSNTQSLKEMRFGLSISVIFGGFISIAILIVGTNINSVDSFLDMALVLRDSLGEWAYILLGVGLFAAGFTSSVTAPMAAGVITKGLFSNSNQSSASWFRIGWFSVLTIGLIFGVLDIKPIPVIIAAQALNGFVLPLLGVILLLKANDSRLLGENINSPTLNVLGFIVLEILILLGLNSLWNLTITHLVLLPAEGTLKFIIVQSVALIVLIYVGFKVSAKRASGASTKD